MIQYDMRCYFNVQSKADMNQPNLPHGTNKYKIGITEKLKKGMLRSIGKQSREFVESVLEKKRNATVGRICRKRF